MVHAHFNVTFEEYVEERLLPSMNFQGEDLSARGGTAQDCYDRCALNFVLGGECRAFTFLTDANAKGKRCWLKRPTYERGRRYPNPGTLSGVLETRGGCWCPTCRRRLSCCRPRKPTPCLVRAQSGYPISWKGSATSRSDSRTSAAARCTSLHVPGAEPRLARGPLALDPARLRCAAPSVCRSVERASHSRRSRPSLPRGAPHAAHLRHFGGARRF